MPALPPPDGPVVLHTAEVPWIRVVPVTGGLSHPWGLAFRQNGDILVTERDKGTLRVIRNGQLRERDIPGVPEVFTDVELAGLMDIAVHPEDDRIVYLTYSQPKERNGRRGATVALARGRLEGGALTEVRDIFVADGWGGGIAASRLLWGPDGKLLMTVGGAFQFAQTGQYAQDPSTHFGKLLRLNDDGTAADDNPFVGNATTCRRFIRRVTGISSVSPSTPRLVISGPLRTGRRVAMRPTSSSRARTMAGRSPPTVASTPASA